MRYLKYFKSHRVHLSIILVISLIFAALYIKSKDIKALPETGSHTSPEVTRKMSFICQDNKKIDAEFKSDSVLLKLSDGRQKEVKQAVTASGERYASEDEMFVFWTKGVTAFIQEGEQTSFADCSQIVESSPKGTGIVTTSGTILCLPHKNQQGPQTMECAYGLKAANGTYYGLTDSDPAYKNISGIPMNQKVEVTGVINLTTSSIYDTIGNITVQSIKQQ